MKRDHEPTPEIMERIHSQCTQRSEHLIWMGRMQGTVPVISLLGTSWSVRRFMKADELLGNPFTLYVSNTCDEPRCLTHLQVTGMRAVQVKARRGIAGLPAEVCEKGHKLTEKSFFWNKVGTKRAHRQCLICLRERNRLLAKKRRARKRAQSAQTVNSNEA